MFIDVPVEVIDNNYVCNYARNPAEECWFDVSITATGTYAAAPFIDLKKFLYRTIYNWSRTGHFY